MTGSGHGRLNSLSLLHRCKVTGNDGDIGQVRLALFDTADWRIRFLVLESSPWLFGRWVLIPPSLLLQPIERGSMHMDVCRRMVRTSPTLHPLQGISAEQARSALLHYGQAAPAAAIPLLTEASLLACDLSSDGVDIGRVVDLVYDDADWMLRYLLVDTARWWQGGHRVLISVCWVDAINAIDVEARQLRVSVDRASVRNSPPFQDIASIDRDYESELHRSHGRDRYWIEPPVAA
ncbi:PRC-barrel domain-containing protein [Mitsuaria sp. 7]|uniref:PRC-barrel domain-containing protein n=1 Tax=Mitsuaria sp. 7 TaxID=1658665 RepID=UPI0007DDA082|nr:PRC-barrel domain-containing protein [Mitsuaria sp. 7]ANH67071.1 hypothetical protein ABE85_04890 [Mitsuaria sp. 7]